MKKLLVILLALLMVSGCSNKPSTTAEAPKELKIEFVPSKDADVIITATEGLDKLLIDAMAKKGYNLDKVTVSVGTSYEATGESLAAGSIDLGWLPGGTYALYSKDVDVILTAQRKGLSNDSEQAKDWNGEANKTLKNGDPVTFYRSLVYAAPTEKGKAIAAKVNAGEKLTWDDVKDATWGIQKTSSSAGYIYPTMWLMDNFDGKKLTDLPHATLVEGGYGSAFANAAAGNLDIIVCYADGRNDYEKAWNLPIDKKDDTGKQGMGREKSIWEELNVIGVTDKIYNDTVAITKAKEGVHNPKFIEALQDSLIEIIHTEAGKKMFEVYSHSDYAKATDKDYDGARKALEAVKN
ncbi:MAG: PhnD/SsuA/transferrin family substrate-binding protein [Erysipelotrichaceae bacterium]|nr:PhnD/SsuA/transferrin family substrate-binding protein [Erysipelotrichaceae bacterium]